MIQKIYDQKILAGDIDAALWKAQTEDYWKAIREGWGKDPAFFDKAQIAMLELRRNVNVFSAFKNHANILELTQALTKPDGTRLSFSEFKKLAKPISKKYYDSWLKAEYNYAVKASTSAAQWIGFQQKGGNLEYKTIGDGRVRDAHRKLEGTILPVNHPFWTLYYPPNGWNCRCFVRWRPADIEAVPPKEIPDVQEMFKNNVGITSQIFDSSHPFIREVGEAQAERIRAVAQQNTLQWERKFIGDKLKQNLVGKTSDVDILGVNLKVNYSSKRLGKAVSQPHEDQFEKNRALLNIQDLIKKARYVLTAPNTSAWKSQAKQYHYLLVEIAGKPSYIVLEELNDGTVYFYSIVDRLKV
jgi:SPP1 gp7 family putative phage head morphogenesis protein